jgi:sulfur relay protein, TusE/DsrC/DsvC family
VDFDEDGYLIDYAQWTPILAEELAATESIILTANHWALIDAVRGYYAEFEHAPSMRPLVKWLKQTYGAEIGNSIYLHKLFPESPAKQLARIAGLPKPTKCL